MHLGVICLQAMVIGKIQTADFAAGVIKVYGRDKGVWKSIFLAIVGEDECEWLY